jgi:hypothetical protein
LVFGIVRCDGEVKAFPIPARMAEEVITRNRDQIYAFDQIQERLRSANLVCRVRRHHSTPFH